MSITMGMRVFIYGVLGLMAALILVDTNLGRPISRSAAGSIGAVSVRSLTEKRLDSDAGMVDGLVVNRGFRESRFLAFVLGGGDVSTGEQTFYAYTPILSRNRVFLGSSFWQVGPTGRLSILIHEMEHVRRHRDRLLRGFPRGSDEAEAYRRQYLTYKSIGLLPDGPDGVVYWDMMIGVRKYVLPRYPEYAKRKDIQQAMGVLKGG